MTVMHIIWESCDKLIGWYASPACLYEQERETLTGGRVGKREGGGEREREIGRERERE